MYTGNVMRSGEQYLLYASLLERPGLGVQVKLRIKSTGVEVYCYHNKTTKTTVPISGKCGLHVENTVNNGVCGNDRPEDQASFSTSSY